MDTHIPGPVLDALFLGRVLGTGLTRLVPCATAFVLRFAQVAYRMDRWHAQKRDDALTGVSWPSACASPDGGHRALAVLCLLVCAGANRFGTDRGQCGVEEALLALPEVVHAQGCVEVQFCQVLPGPDAPQHVLSAPFEPPRFSCVLN